MGHNLVCLGVSKWAN